MITLKDYIGRIYKEVTNAKVQSDIETLAIAEEYVNNPMLKHFSVPNIRMKNIELTIPVAVDKAEPTSRPYTQLEVQQAYESAFEKAYLGLFPHRTAHLEKIKKEISHKAEQVSVATAPNLEVATNAAVTAESVRPVENVAKDVQQTSSKSVKETAAKTSASISASKEAEITASKDVQARADYTSVLNEAATNFAEASYSLVDVEIPQSEFNARLIPAVVESLQPKPLELEALPVIVETQRLKEINDASSMINIKVNITDDAMEWTTDVDEDGTTTQVLNYL